MTRKELLQVKMFALIVFILAINSSFLYGQSSVDTNKYSRSADVSPEFPGGEKGLMCFCDKTVDKEKLKTISKTGFVIAQFIINEIGTVTEVTIAKSLDTIADNEFIRILKLMPKWKPGEYRGKVVSVLITLPLKVPYENKCTSGK